MSNVIRPRLVGDSSFITAVSDALDHAKEYCNPYYLYICTYLFVIAQFPNQFMRVLKLLHLGFLNSENMTDEEHIIENLVHMSAHIHYGFTMKNSVQEERFVYAKVVACLRMLDDVEGALHYENLKDEEIQRDIDKAEGK